MVCIKWKILCFAYKLNVSVIQTHLGLSVFGYVTSYCIIVHDLQENLSHLFIINMEMRTLSMSLIKL